jgi:dienelactone hydrolase
MTDLPPPEPLFLPGDPDPAFATLHRPALDRAAGTAVLLSPPFGWEEVCSYRGLRQWATRLAQAGYPALRLTFPGTGDAGGDPWDPDRLRAWTASVAAAADLLRSEAGARRVTAVGLGLGGLVACLATAEGAAVDDLVLWATPSRGRSLVRALRAFSKLESAAFYEGLPAPPPVPEGDFDAGGFVLTAATLSDLEAVDLGKLQLPAPAGRRALLLARDGLAPDEALRERLVSLGVAVQTAAGEGYGDLTSHPQTATAPLAVMMTVERWLAEAPPGASDRTGEPASYPPVAAQAEIRVGDVAVRETALSIPQAFGQMAAILTEPLERPAGDTAVILLNAGAVRRTGPSRMWVEAARRWAAAGVLALRLDVEGIGDADGDGTSYRDDAALYTPAFVPQVLAAVDFLQARGVASRFVLGGLCSGAYWSFHAALQDSRISAVLLLNPRVLIWSDELAPARDMRALLTQRPSLSRIRRLATGPRLRAFTRWLAGAPLRLWRRLSTGQAPAAKTELALDAALERLVTSGTRTLLLFSDHEPLHDELERTGRLATLATRPNVVVEYVPVRDHTMRPTWSQNAARAAMDRVVLGSGPEEVSRG